MSKAKLEARIDMALGGFTAEEIQYGAENVSTGPASDLAAVNKLARFMVQSGFGKRSGFLQIPENAFEASETAKRTLKKMFRISLASRVLVYVKFCRKRSRLGMQLLKL